MALRRVYLKLVESPIVINSVALAIKVIHRLFGDSSGNMFTKVLALLLTGPLESRPFGWVNIQKSRLYWKLLRSATGSKTLPAKKPLPLLHCTLRIGVYGTFVGLLNFPKTLFEDFPRQKANLLIFDVET